MNSLILYPGELIDGSRVELSKERLAHFREHHSRVSLGLIKLAVLGGKIGTGRVLEDSGSKVTIECLEWFDPVPKLPVRLVVGLCRPQILKNIIRCVVNTGVQSLAIVRCESSEKSYLDSHVLSESSIQGLVVKYLEQSYDSIPPVITVHRKFKPFVEDELLLREDEERLIFEMSSKRAGVADFVGSKRLLIAVGPEGGWNDFERGLFMKKGFQDISLGNRILRVDVATSVSIGLAMSLLGKIS